MLEKDRFFYKKLDLSEKLKDHVKYGWMMKSSDCNTSNPDLLIPDGYPEIIFVLDGTYQKVGIQDRAKVILIKKSCLVGIQTQTIFASRLAPCRLVGLKLYPWTAYQIFSNHLSNAANQNLVLEDIKIKWLIDLEKEIQSFNNEIAISQSISTKFQKAILSNNSSIETKLAQSFVKKIINANGQISVKTLAESHHLSIRHFQRKFKQFYGITPKKFINIIRFKKLYKASVLQENLPNNFLNYGYYDQMHFIKDFRKQLGITPSNSFNKAFLKLNQMAKDNL